MKRKKTLQKDKKIIPTLSISISILFIISVIRYTQRSFAYPIWDEQHYMAFATFAYRELHHPTLNSYSNILSVVPYHEPGYPLFILPFLFIFGIANSYEFGIITNRLLHIASMFGVYLLAKKYLSKFSAFLAAVIFLFYAWPLYFVHLTYAETATSTLCVWSIYFYFHQTFLENEK